MRCKSRFTLLCISKTLIQRSSFERTHMWIIFPNPVWKKVALKSNLSQNKQLKSARVGKTELTVFGRFGIQWPLVSNVTDVLNVKNVFDKSSVGKNLNIQKNAKFNDRIPKSVWMEKIFNTKLILFSKL